MILPDVNVLVYAFREDAPDHAAYRAWLLSRLAAQEAFGLSDLVLAGVLRVLTHPKVFLPPTPLDPSLEYLQALRNQPNAVVLAPGARHWQIFTGLCRAAGAKGNRTRFPGLRWRHPLLARP